MKKTISFDFIEECQKALKQNFNGIESFTYGSCCNTCYYDIWKRYPQNDDDFVNAKIFIGGLNNNFNFLSKKFELKDTIYYNWHLTKFKLDDIINVMKQVAKKYDYEIIIPTDKFKSIGVTVNKK